MSIVMKTLSGLLTAGLTFFLYKFAGPVWAITYVGFNQGWFEAKTWISVGSLRYQIQEMEDEQNKKANS